MLTNLFVSLFFDETKTIVFWCSLSFARTVGACIDWWMTLSSTTVPIGGKMMIYVYCIPTFHSEFHDSELIWPNESVFKTCFSKGPNVRKSWIVAKCVGERCFFSFWIDSFCYQVTVKCFLKVCLDGLFLRCFSFWWFMNLRCLHKCVFVLDAFLLLNCI